MSFIGKYTNIGIRRDNSLSDLNNRKDGLLNLLDDLNVTSGVSLEDISPLRSIRDTNVTTADLREIIGSTVIYTDENRIVRNVLPIITLRDYAQNTKLITGDPPYLVGGDGLNAKFYPSDVIRPENELKDIVEKSFTDGGRDLTGDDLFADITFKETRKIEENNFWDLGVFSFNSLMHPEFRNPYGMVVWEGYFTPISLEAEHYLSIESTGNWLIEVDYEDNGNYETVSSSYSETKVIVSPSFSIRTPNGLTFRDAANDSGPEADTPFYNKFKYIAEGDQLIQWDDINLENQNLFVTNTFSPSLDFRGITFSSASDTLTSVPLTTNTTLTFRRRLGIFDAPSKGNFQVPPTFANNKYKFRISVWWPDPNDSSIFYDRKYAVFEYDQARSESYIGYLSKSYLYTSNNSDSNVQLVESVESVITNRLSPWNRETTNPFIVNSSLIVNYEPSLLRDDYVLLTEIRAEYYDTNKYAFTFSDIPVLSSQIDDYFPVGTYFVDSGSPNPDFFQYKRYLRSGFRLTDNLPSTSISFLFEAQANSLSDIPTSLRDTGIYRFDVFSYKALVGLYKLTNSTGTQVDLTPLSSFEKQVIKPNSIIAINRNSSNDVIDYPLFRILTVQGNSSPYTVTVEPIGDIPQDGTVSSTLPDDPLLDEDTVIGGVYHTTGIEDSSTEPFCEQVFGQTVSTQVEIASTAIELSDASGVSVGLYAQYQGSIPDGTTVSSISGNTITLSQPTSNIIPVDVLLTFSPVADNREYCVVSLDSSGNAFPFESTEIGIKTQSGTEGIEVNTLSTKKLKINADTSQITEIDFANITEVDINESITFTHNQEEYEFLIS